MEYSEANSPVETTSRILCCQCGSAIAPNPSNMCVACLRTQVDITEGIPKQVIIYFCKKCERYQQQMGQWIGADLESSQLMSFCLKKLKSLNKVNLVDATFVWTEPHSKRIKIKLTVQKEVMGGTILQQTFVVEFVVNGHMCEDCHRREAKDFWKAVVQVRQKTDHKKTFFYLEQLLIKHKSHDKCVNIKAIDGGIDFFFDRKDEAKKLVDFLLSVIPCRYQTSQQLISHDTHNNTYNYKYTYAVEIVPICKDDIVCLPLQTAQSIGNIGQICVVIRVTNLVYLVDPFTLRTCELTANNYFRNPFRSICSSKQLTEHIVMDIELTGDDIKVPIGKRSDKHLLADIWVVRSSEIGSDNQKHSRTHLGHLLKPGDTCLAFDINGANINEPNFEKYEKNNSNKIPDVIVIKKYFGDKVSRNRRREWKLRRIEIDKASDGSSANREYMDFMEDLEEDPMLRQNVNIYADKEKMESGMAVDLDELEAEAPKITLQEMLEDLVID
ncbi:unnamed protein product [Oppiella nova]|uniref:60S ribosomal export protein NMD3 n=1 Tax=Oppiella nova TaxID=334625 RepID=A0A7R9LEQ7_9ACAR|nr:unnamed protein product [Oppiella nova]CAG2162212.1 unnamed protein product [Oppiella nova]